MLAEGFLRTLCYREERKVVSTSKRKKLQTNPYCADPFNCTPSDLSCADPRRHSTEGLLIPGSSPALAIHPVYVEDCSLLEQYPDLQVADSGRISHNVPRISVNQPDYFIQPPVPEACLRPISAGQQEPQGDPLSSIPDQGYLVMGDSENISLDLPGSGLEPMSNSVLNGLLEKQLEEVYMQHLTDNLARCNSHLENSLLQDLVPLPQPSCLSQGPDSLEAGLEDSGNSGNKISYMNTHNLVPCSSNFSSPLLRISENPHP
ncbi:uncharacterized protein si:dkey-237j10.2 isoform X2 [Mugil cephalus]|uniref:uncharacterized protein si:dkey-237j10.2 isoform X2 n=1 Tax=Mugil cephalus TaxID=48193 RepID=UPI001FB82784|nr:uncharacterized protein si:dkey-237j10.2 isoform X2 [Mugil cephalus]